MEVEVKYTVLNEDAYTALTQLNRIAGYDVQMGETRNLLDTYFDTSDLRILAARYACRRRRDGHGAHLTLKGLGTVGQSPDRGRTAPALHRRTEMAIAITEDVEQDPKRWPPGPIRDLVLGFTEGRSLVKLFDIEQERHARAVVSPHGRAVAELSLDRGHIRTRAGSEAFIELEVELLEDGSESDLDRLTEVLATVEGLVPQPASKFERGLALIRRQPDTETGTGYENTGETVGEAVHRIVYPLFQKMLAHERGTYVGEDPEELHDMRVAIRRMRTALRIAAPYLDMKALSDVQSGLQKTARTLGAVRDMDVFREHAIAHVVASTAPPSDFALLMTIWNVEYARRRNDLLDYLDSRGYAHFIEKFEAQLEAGLPEQGSGTPIRAIVQPVLAAQLAVVETTLASLEHPDASLQTYHQLRIDVKHLRYTLEFFRPDLGPEAREAIEILREVQDTLGELQDAVVAVEHLQAVTRFGTWELPRQAASLWATPTATTEVTIAGGLAAYLQARVTEMKTLLADAPRVCRRLRESRLAQKVYAALRPLQERAGATKSHTLYSY